MSPFNRNLLLLLGGIAGVLLIAAGSTYLVEYKPWGVPDAVRGKYEAKLVAIDQRNQLVASWENRSRPKVTCRSFYEVGGRRDQSSETFQFTVRNDGDLPLTLTVLKSSNESVCETPTEPIAPPSDRPMPACQDIHPRLERGVPWRGSALPSTWPFHLEAQDPETKPRHRCLSTGRMTNPPPEQPSRAHPTARGHGPNSK